MLPQAQCSPLYNVYNLLGALVPSYAYDVGFFSMVMQMYNLYITYISSFTTLAV